MICPFCKYSNLWVNGHFTCPCGARLYKGISGISGNCIIIWYAPFKHAHTVISLGKGTTTIYPRGGDELEIDIPSLPLTTDYESYKDLVLNKIKKLFVFI